MITTRNNVPTAMRISIDSVNMIVIDVGDGVGDDAFCILRSSNM